MKTFLDLSRVAPAFYQQVGLIPITDKLTDEIIITTEVRVYGGQDGDDEPSFRALEVMG